MPHVSDIIHVFNSSLVSGPETMVFPNIIGLADRSFIILLSETRCKEGALKVQNYAESLGHRIISIPVRGRLDISAIVNLRYVIKTMNARVIHSHGPKATLYVALAQLALRTQSLFITTHHGVRANNLSPTLKFYEFLYEKVAIPYHHRVLTVCSSDKELLAHRGLPRDKLIVHLNGVDRPTVTRQDALHKFAKLLSKSHMSLPNTTINFVVVARLAKEKRHSLILSSLRALNNPDVHLHIFGSGPLEDLLKNLCLSMKISNQVHFWGYHSDIYDYLPAFDCMISLSEAEGLPINLIEAAYAGLPIIATRVDGVSDFMPNDSYGFLLPEDPTIEEVTHAIKTLISDPTLAQSKARNLSLRAKSSFSSQAWLNNLLAIYSTLGYYTTTKQLDNGLKP